MLNVLMHTRHLFSGRSITQRDSIVIWADLGDITVSDTAYPEILEQTGLIY